MDISGCLISVQVGVLITVFFSVASKRLLAAAIHKKINVYDIASASSTPVRSSFTWVKLI
jgi:hypothetical protein